MMRGERRTLWHGRHTKEACTLRGAQTRKVPFRPFRVLNRYHVGAQSNKARIVFRHTTSWSALSRSHGRRAHRGGWQGR